MRVTEAMEPCASGISGAQVAGMRRLRKFVVERRHHLKLRQQDVADRGDLSHSWVTSFEVGRLNSLPRTDTLIRLARGLMLPDEHAGSLHNFMLLVLAGSLDGRTVAAVATGRRDPAAVMEVESKSSSKLDVSGGDHAPAVFHLQQERSGHFEAIVRMLWQDLPADDARLAVAFLRRLYDDVPVPLTDRPHPRAPRRRRGQPERGG